MEEEQMLLVELGSRAGVYQSMPFERLVLPISGLQVALNPSLCFSGLVQGRGVWKMYKIRLANCGLWLAGICSS